MSYKREGESIYHILRGFTYHRSNLPLLYAQWNVPKASQPFTLRDNLTYRNFPWDLSNLWLRADLIDLYFEWKYLREASDLIWVQLADS